MYSGEYAPWDHYPKTLRHYDVQNPFRVIKDFFSADWPKGHRKQLKKWRYYATADTYYNHKRFGPGNLIFTYKLNLNLLEAMYLLLLEHESAWKPKKLGEEQLVEERNTWKWFPKNLSDEALLDPFIVVKKVFADFSLPEYRDHLHEWFDEALSVRTTAETMDPGDVIGVYENMIKLYSAAWLIYQRGSDDPYLEKELDAPETAIENDVVRMLPVVAGPIVDCSFNTKLTPAEELGLDELVKLIIKELPTVKLIVYLGTHPQPFTYYLLVLVDDSETLLEHEISNKIEDKCRSLTLVFAFSHKLCGLQKALAEGRRFFIDALRGGKVPYIAADFPMPELPKLSVKNFAAKAELNYNKWGSQANEFWLGAKYYQEIGSYNLAAFSMHQAIESGFIALISAILGYKVNVHNLSRMMRITSMFTDKLKEVFKLDTEEGVQLFQLLRKVYSNARYNSSYQLDEKTVDGLSQLVPAFLSAGQLVYLKFMEQFAEHESE